MKRVLVVLLLFIFSFLIRVFFWIFGFSSYLNWVIYDVGLYVDSGRELITSLINSNDQVIRSLIFHPLLGFYTTGLFSISLSGLIDKYSAGLLSPILFSSLMCLVVFLIGERIGSFKMGFIAWLLASFDPYSIQFSTTFLDMPATFFSTLFMFLLIKYVPSTNWKRFVLLGIVAGLAFSSKHIVIPLVGLLILLHVKKVKDCLIIVAVAIVSYLLVNFPKFLSLENVKLMLNANIQGGGIGIPAIIYGPIEIGKPYTYPWYILTYLGLGYTGVSVSPYSIPVIALVFYLYQRFSMGASVLKTNIYKILVSYIAFSVLPLILLPRNYWVPISRFPGVSGESNVLTKFFYPYYYVITIPAFSIFTAYLICVRKGICRFICQITQLKDSLLLRIFEILTMIFLLLSPFNFSANTIYPFWDFIFTLLVNVEKEEVLVRIISYYSILILTIILAFISLAALITTRRKIK
jgi:hypothetical protein